MKLNKKITAAMVTAAALFGSVANAQQNGSLTGNMKVTTTVDSTCVLEVANIEVGEFTASATGVTTGTGDIKALCSAQVPFTIAFNSGSGTNSAKKLSSTGTQDILNYSLKASQIGSTEKFEVSAEEGGMIKVTSEQNAGAKITFPLTVEIANNQYVAPGDYKDTINAILTY